MKDSKLLGGTLLISGTTIGAGILAFPISTGIGGFIPAMAVFTVCWLFMLWAAFIILEVNLSLSGDVNLISMAQTTLGPVGAGIAWVGFLLLLYSLLAAYMTGSGPLFLEGVKGFTGVVLPKWTAPLPILLLFGPFVYISMRAVDYMNRYLMIGLIVTYALMLTLLFGRLDSSLLLRYDLEYSFISFGVIITAFGYHIIIPSLATYLGRDLKKIKLCLFMGSLLPFLTYFLWELLILGTVPVSGEHGIAHALLHGISLSQSLQTILGSPVITLAARLFSIFAIITSFLGVAQSCFDFLKDGFKIRDNKKGRALVWILTFLPPLIFVSVFQKGFVTVLEYAGLIIAILIGILPILMVWSARYRLKLTSHYHVIGGRGLFVCGLLFYTAIVALVIATHTGWIHVDINRYL